MKRGRPLRFLALVLGGWTAARVAVLWPGDVLLAGPQAAALPRAIFAEEVRVAREEGGRLMAAGAGASTARSSLTGGSGGSIGIHEVAASNAVTRRPSQARPDLLPGEGAARDATAARAIAAAGREAEDRTGSPPDVRPGPAFDRASTIGTAGSRRGARLHGDAWLVARPGGGATLAFGQLGASQAGARVTYALDADRRLALSGRVSAPLGGRGSEAAAGLDWRPLPLPVHLLAELRVPLDGGRPLPAAQLIGGGAARLPVGLQLEGYAQAGAVSRRGSFADGSARIARPVATAGHARVDAGVGAWGAAQRRLARLDVGPSVGVALPVGRVGVRLGADYRFRVAGRARPGSGPAVTLGGSF